MNATARGIPSTTELAELGEEGAGAGEDIAMKETNEWEIKERRERKSGEVHKAVGVQSLAQRV